MKDGHGFDQPTWQGLRTQNAIDHDFEGQGVQQRQRERDYAQSGDANEVRPATPRFQEHTSQDGFIPQSTVQRTPKDVEARSP